MADYRLTDGMPVLRTVDDVLVFPGCVNQGWERYQEWLADGGVPDPYIEPPPPEPQPDPMAEAQRANDRLDAGVQAAVDTKNALTSVARETPVGDAPVTQAELAVLQTQVDDLQAIVQAMLEAQAGE